MFTLAIWCRVVKSRDVRSRDFSAPISTAMGAKRYSLPMLAYFLFIIISSSVPRLNSASSAVIRRVFTKVKRW